MVGLDDDVKGVGRPVLVTIEADGQKLAEVTLQRGVKDKSGPVPLVRNVKDVKKLRIVVTHDPAEFLDLGLACGFGRRLCEQVTASAISIPEAGRAEDIVELLACASGSYPL